MTKQEKIVPLCEDSKSHKHNEDSYEKMVKQQEEAKRRLAENKTK